LAEPRRFDRFRRDEGQNQTDQENDGQDLTQHAAHHAFRFFHGSEGFLTVANQRNDRQHNGYSPENQGKDVHERLLD
jgi:hypothetical protein